MHEAEAVAVHVEDALQLDRVSARVASGPIAEPCGRAALGDSLGALRLPRPRSSSGTSRLPGRSSDRAPGRSTEHSRTWVRFDATS